MSTVTQSRVMLTLAMPKALADALDTDKQFSDCSMASLMRRITKWHRGEGPGRHPEAPKPKFPNKKSTTRSSKSFLIDESDAEYLDELSDRTGLSRATSLLMIAYQWFDVDPLARKQGK